METKGTVAFDATSALTLAGQAQAALTNATDLVIDSPTMYELAGQELMEIKALQKTVEAQRTAITGPLNAATKAVNDLFRGPKEFLDRAEIAIKKPMIAWSTEQDRLAAMARQEAERLAAIERNRLASILREQEDQQRQAEEASMVASMAAMAATQAGDMEAASAAHELAREQHEIALDAAAEAQATAMTAEIITIAPSTVAQAKVSGISGRVTYRAEVIDLMALVQAVAAGTAPIQCLAADEKFLGAQARAFKQPGPIYPGVNVIAERILAARAA